MSKKICFVVMGYGVKIDYSTGRELDLDKTYRNIVKPAVIEAGLECIRADDIKHSGIIDIPMYHYLYSADVVIADLSTYNPNAFYELGIRHALRPHTTIAIAEKELKYPFDLSHTVIRTYEHLGKGIDHDEVMRFREELQDAIQSILENPSIDSPVYSFLNELTPPILKSTLEVASTSNEKESLSSILEYAQNAMDNKDFVVAKGLFLTASTIDPNSIYIKQKIVLATYKSKYPDQLSALNEAYEMLQTLNPESTTDPETLGLLGAVCKRLWEVTEVRTWLDKAIFFYEKGFYIKNDYYNGINFAFLLNVRGSNSGGNEAIADYVSAERVRFKVIEICKSLLESSFESRGDKYWILATLEEAFFGVDMLVEYALYKTRAETLVTNAWERDSTNEQINKLAVLLERSPMKVRITGGPQ